MGKWDRLGTYLERVGRARVVLTYDQIEEIVGSKVPDSARRHRPQFWANALRNPTAQSWMRVGYRSRLSGLTPNQIAFERDHAAQAEPAKSQPATAVASATAAPASRAPDKDLTLVLVGCVKRKASSPRPARDLYLSTRFEKGRAYAEATGKPWAILTALHGVVLPDAVIAPYDLALSDAPSEYRREWGARVLHQLREAFGPLDGQVIEVHAPKTYVEPLLHGLTAAGAEVRWPFEGLRQGEQLAWYSDHSPPTSDVTIIPEPAAMSPQAQAASPEAAPSRGTSSPAATGTGRAGRSGPAAGSGLAARITLAFQQGELNLRDRRDAPPPGWSSMPEVVAVKRLQGLGAGSATVRLFCTFAMAMDRARDADLLWLRCADLFAEAPWAFEPREIARRRLLDLADVLRRFGVSQRHTTDAAAWRTIGEALVSPQTVPAVHAVIHEGVGDTRELLRAITETTAVGTPYFPLLSGPKIAPVWVRILAYPGGARISGLAALPVGVDVQVRKVTEYLGVTDTRDLSLDEARPIIQQVWHDDVRQHGAHGPGDLKDTPAAVDPALWFFGKWGCTRCERARARIPISPLCHGCRLEPTHGPAVDV